MPKQYKYFSLNFYTGKAGHPISKANVVHCGSLTELLKYMQCNTSTGQCVRRKYEVIRI